MASTQPNWFSRFSNDNQNVVFWFFLFAAVVIFFGIGMRSPWPADEPRFAQIAREMVESGQWLFPMRGNEYYPDKPPVFMWSIAIFYALTGSLKIAFLLPSALASMVSLAAVYDIGKRLWNQQTGLIAAALLLCTVQFVLQAKSAQIDAMVTCWITLGCYGLLRFMLVDHHWRWYYFGCFFMGIGVITKGVGFLPILLVIPYALYRSFFVRPAFPFSLASAGKWLAGPLVMLLAISLWVVPMLLVVESSNDPLLTQYRDNILFRQTVTRYANSWHHIKPFWYYITSVIPPFWLPLSVAIPWLIPKWYRHIKQGDGRIILPLGWIVLVILFFSMSPGKRGVYMLPAVPMLALVSAPYIRELIASKGLKWLLYGIVLVLSVALLIFGIGGIAGLKAAVKLEDKFEVAPWYFLIATGLIGTAICALNARKNQWQAWPFFICMLWIGYSSWGSILLEDVKTPKNVYTSIQQTHGDNIEIGLVDFSEQFLLFSPYPITHFGFHPPADAQMSRAYQWVGEGSNRFILTSAEHVSAECFNVDTIEHMGFAHRTDWVLLSADDRLPGCPLSDEAVPEYRYQPGRMP